MAGWRMWGEEARATVLLAWPMILTNLGQTAMTATDVLMMGRLGAERACRRLAGLQPLFPAADLRPRPDAGDVADDRDGARPQAPFGARRAPHRAPGPVDRHHRRAADLGFPVAGRGDPARDGPGPELAVLAGSYVRALQWAVLPFYGYIVLRSFISALERPGWALAVVFLAVGFNVFANWCLMYGNLGFPALGLPGAGWPPPDLFDADVRGPGTVVIAHRRNSAATACSAASGAPTGRASARCLVSACRSPACSPSRCRSSTSPPS
jgi:MATE family multidrug resistance protein